MPNRLANDDRMTGPSDRERVRDVSEDSDAGTTSRGASARQRSNRGFASMDPGKQKEIASKGGRAAHAKGTAHEFDTGEAREAGRKGGVAVSQNREHMAAIGRRGGEARGHGRNRSLAQGASEGAGSEESAQQNGRASTRDRQVTVPGHGEGLGSGQSAGSTRGASASSLGGERRPSTPMAGENDQSTQGERESFGNH